MSMRKIFAGFISLLFSAHLLAQIPIVIDSVHMPLVGDTLHSIRDVMPAGFSIGNAGANQLWDFSNLNGTEPVTTYSLDPANTPYGGNYPNATHAFTNDFTNYLYNRLTSQEYKVEGLAGDIAGLGIITTSNFNPPYDLYRFPTQYQNTFSGNYSFTETIPFSALPANLQQQIINNLPPLTSATNIRLSISSYFMDEIDAWGTAITPVGAYECLRQKRTDSTETVIEVQLQPIIGSPFWIEITRIPSNTTDHQWLTQVSRQPLITLGYDSLRNITSVAYSLAPPLPIAQFTFTNTSGGLVIFNNNSQYGSGYYWDFDDSSMISQDTSAVINYLYTANGDYYVCLTATNSSGRDTFCDTVKVTGVGVNNPPVAIDDSAAVIAPDSILLTPLANDFDPDGDNIFLQWVTNPSNGTVIKFNNGTVQYKPNAGSSGMDQFSYKICDDGVPQLCDTGMVYIDVKSLPTVDFDYVPNGLAVTFTNRSVNFDSIHWNLGDGATGNLPSFTHQYAAKAIYQVCLTAVNEVGSSTSCKQVNLLNVNTDDLTGSGIKLYPNPAGQWLYLDYNLPDGGSYTIFNSLGTHSYSDVLPGSSQQIQIDLADFPAGVYFLQLTDKQAGAFYNARFIKLDTFK